MSAIYSDEAYWIEKAMEILYQLDTDDILPADSPQKLSDSQRSGLIARLNGFNAQIENIRYPPETEAVDFEPEPEWVPEQEPEDE